MPNLCANAKIWHFDIKSIHIVDWKFYAQSLSHDRQRLTLCLVWPFWPFHPIYWDGNGMEKMVLKMVWNCLKMVCKNDVRMI